jgi:hypothetical protein
MKGGTKGGAQRASSLRPRCVGEVNPETATHIYISIYLSLYLSLTLDINSFTAAAYVVCDIHVTFARTKKIYIV